MQLTIGQRIMVLVLAPLFLVTLALGWQSLSTLQQLSDGHINKVRQQMLALKEKELTQYLDIVSSSIAPIYDNAQADDLEAQTQVRDLIRKLRYGQSGYFFAYTETGTNLVLPNNPAREGTNMWQVQDPDGNYVIQLLVDAAKKGGAVFQYKWEKTKGEAPQPKLAYAIPLSKWGWAVGTGFYIDDIEREIEAIRTTAHATRTEAVLRLALVAAVALAIAILLGMTIARSITRPLLNSVRLMRDIAEGDGDLTQRMSVYGKTEIDQLAIGFNTFVEKIHDIIRDVRGHAQELKTQVDQVSEMSQQQSDEMTTLHAQTTQVATAITEMSSSASEVARSANGAAEAANKAHNESDSGHQEMSQALAAINRLNTQLEGAEEVITKVEKESDGIGSVLEVIGSIAEQTNLLALNAAIEAARAGENGRGFAVVADEVRTLASRSQKATQEIQSMIEKLQTESRQAVSVMQSSREQSTQTVNSAQRTGDSLTVIADSVQVINNMNQQIAAAAEEQTSVSDEISRNVTQISDISSSISDGLHSTATTAQTLSARSDQLHDLVEQFKL